MKRKGLARTLARRARISGAVAQDRVDSVVHDILKELKAGHAVKLPGMGKLVVTQITKRTQRGPGDLARVLGKSRNDPARRGTRK